MKRREICLCVLFVAVAALASTAGIARADGACPPGQYETASGCVCPSGTHLGDGGQCVTDDLSACPAGQYASASGCVCPAGEHATASTECAYDTPAPLTTAAVAGAHKTTVKHKRHRHHPQLQ
jgi:hypothetical protein